MSRPLASIPTMPLDISSRAMLSHCLAGKGRQVSPTKEHGSSARTSSQDRYPLIHQARTTKRPIHYWPYTQVMTRRIAPCKHLQGQSEPASSLHTRSAMPEEDRFCGNSVRQRLVSGSRTTLASWYWPCGKAHQHNHVA